MPSVCGEGRPIRETSALNRWSKRPCRSAPMCRSAVFAAASAPSLTVFSQVSRRGWTSRTAAAQKASYAERFPRRHCRFSSVKPAMARSLRACA